MPELRRPAGGSAARIVILPAEIDSAIARRIRSRLTSAVLREVDTVVVDMTRATFCDREGASSLAEACRDAAANGVDLRLVIPSAAAFGVFTVRGQHVLLPAYPSIDDAFAARPA